MARPKGIKNKVKKSVIPSVVDEYLVTLKMADKVYATQGSDLVEALKALKPEIFKTKGVLTVVKGDKRIERLLTIQNIKMLQFNSQIPVIRLSQNLKLLMGIRTI